MNGASTARRTDTGRAWELLTSHLWPVQTDQYGHGNHHLLTSWHGNQQTRFDAAETGIDQYLSVEIDKRGHVWVLEDDQEHQHLKVFDGSGWTKKDSAKFVAGGRNRSSFGHVVRCVPSESSGSALLIHVDKRTSSYPIPPGRLSQFTNDIHPDHNGSVWLIGETRFAPVDLEKWRGLGDDYRSSGFECHCCLERAGESLVQNGRNNRRQERADAFFGRTAKTFDTDPILSWSKAEDGTLLFGSKGKFYVIPNGDERTPIPVNLPEEDQVISIVKARNQTYWLGISKAWCYLP